MFHDESRGQKVKVTSHGVGVYTLVSAGFFYLSAAAFPGPAAYLSP